MFLARAALALLFSASPALAAGPAPGRYQAMGGAGELVIERKGAGTGFTIETVGPNGHTCFLEGELTGNVGVVPAADGADECRIQLTPAKGGFDVDGITHESCRTYCGMRGSYDHAFRPLPASCTDTKVKSRDALFLTQYRKKDYPRALATVQLVQSECSAYQHWLERDKRANDIALTLHHMGRKTECLAVLEDTMAWDLASDEDVKQSLPPLEAEAYLSTAKAIRFNRALCSRKPAKR